MKTSVVIALFLTGAVARSQVTNGLLASYYFNGNANDASGHGVNGVLVNNPLLVADRFGNPNAAFQFNGSTNYISLPAGTFSTLNAYSYSFWMKPLSNTSHGIPICVGDAVSGYCQAVTYQAGGSLFGGSYNVGGNPTQSYVQSAAIPPNTWYHVVMTRDSVRVKLFIDCNEVTNNPNAYTTSQPASYGGQPVYARIGARTTNIYYFNGIIDDVKVYNRMLTGSEICALHAETTAGVAENSYEGVSIFPNPALSNIRVSCAEKSLFILYSLNGVPVRTAFLFPSTDNNIVLDGLDAGMYIYRMSNNSGNSTGKLMIVSGD